MKAVFYQKMMPAGKFVKVGEAEIPDGIPSWKYAVRKELKAYMSYDLASTSNSPISEYIEYFRNPLVFEPNAYIAVTNLKLEE